MKPNSRYIELHAILILLGGVTSLIAGSQIYLVISGILAFSFMWYRRIKYWNSDGVLFGIANATTLTRLGVLMVAVLCYSDITPYVFGLIILAVIIADGLDGYLARKYKLESNFGALFDMETDAFLAATISTLIVFNFDIGVITTVVLLIAGYLRYIFVLMLRLLGLHNAEQPHMPYAKILAVVYFISLTIPFLLTSPYASDFSEWNSLPPYVIEGTVEFGIWYLEFALWSLYIGSFCVIGSFAYEFVLKFRNHTK